MKIYHRLICLFIIITFTVLSCTDGLTDEYKIKFGGQEVAVPLAYGKLGINTAIENTNAKNQLLIGPDGKVTAVYTGEVLRQNASQIFPPVPGFFDFLISDTSVYIPLPYLTKNAQIEKGIFDNTNLSFKFKHNKKEKIRVVMTIPSVKRNGVVWKQEYNLDFGTDDDGEIITGKNTVLGWTALPIANAILFKYEAYRPNGERIKLDYASMLFDVMSFSYLEGYFDRLLFDIKGDFIKINLFQNWKKGGLEILNPKIKLDVENALGFPIRSKINSLTLKTKTGNVFNLESDYINKGIDFNYPTLAEIHQFKNTTFTFDNTNSNIETLFKDKIVQVAYDFDAISNPDANDKIKNFFTNTAYYKVNVSVSLPLNIKANEFTIGDTLAIDASSLKDITEGNAFINVQNTFPVNMDLDMVFLDIAGKELDRLSSAELIKIKGAPLGPNGKTTVPTTTKQEIKISPVRQAKIIQAKKVYCTAIFDTNTYSNLPVWIYDDYYLQIELSANAKIK
jgi:hypothetical protein